MNSSRDQEWADALIRAREAGLAKGRMVNPPGMTVVMSDFLTDEVDADSPREDVSDGPHGGAALEFSSDGSPEANDFLQWLTRERPTAYPPPFEVAEIDDPAVIKTYVGDLGPSAAPNIAATEEMAQRLQGLVTGLTVEAHAQLD